MTTTTMSAPLRGNGEARAGDVDRIKAGIERTQADLAKTVAQLQQKLTVSHFVAQIRRGAQEVCYNLGETSLGVVAIALDEAQGLFEDARNRVRRNPAPAALIGAGIATILWHGQRRRQRRAEDLKSR